MESLGFATQFGAIAPLYPLISQNKSLIWTKYDKMTGAGTLNSADAGTLDTPIYTLLSRARAPSLLQYWQGGWHRFVVNRQKSLRILVNRTRLPIMKKNSSYGTYWYLYSYQERYLAFWCLCSILIYMKTFLLTIVILSIAFVGMNLSLLIKSQPLEKRCSDDCDCTCE